MTASATAALQSAKSLYLLLKRSSSSAELDADALRTVLADMERHLAAAPLLQIPTFLKTLAAAVRTVRKQATTTTTDNSHDDWEALVQACTRLTQRLKAQQAAGEAAVQAASTSADDDGADCVRGPPATAAAYRQRLQRQHKEIYKNPPVLPPSLVKILEAPAATPPVRDAATGCWTFGPAATGGGKYDKSAIASFQPNTSPAEILQGGAFGGTYFRSLVSAVTNTAYVGSDVVKDSVDPSWVVGLDEATMLTSATYRKEVNKFKKQCGGSLGMWESSGVRWLVAVCRIFVSSVEERRPFVVAFCVTSHASCVFRVCACVFSRLVCFLSTLIYSLTL
jgi:hypothetical protein